MKIVDENNIACFIKNKSLWGTKKIIDDKGKIRYTIEILDLINKQSDHENVRISKYVIKEGSLPIATASIQFSKSSQIKATQHLRLPKVEVMYIDISGDTWKVIRKSNNSLIIQNAKATIGQISSFFTMKHQTMTMRDDFDVPFLAGIYALTLYMMHEDDLIMV